MPVRYNGMSSFVWNVCDDVFRGLFHRHEYGDILLLFLRLLFNGYPAELISIDEKQIS